MSEFIKSQSISDLSLYGMLFSIVRIDRDCYVETMILITFHCFLIIQNIYLLKKTLLLLQKDLYKTCLFFHYSYLFQIYHSQWTSTNSRRRKSTYYSSRRSIFFFSSIFRSSFDSSSFIISACSSSLLSLIHIAYSSESINKCSSTCLNTKRTLFKRGSFYFIFIDFS